MNIKRSPKYTTVLPRKTDGLVTIRTDVGGFGSSGRGSMPLPEGCELRVGDKFAITDEGCDTMLAVVLTELANGVVEVQIEWDTVLEYA